MKVLADYDRAKVIDVLDERLTFERAGVKLYDAIILRMERSPDPDVAGMIEEMRLFRDQEKEHEEWLEAQIRALGGDAHAMTDRALLVERESEGIRRVIMDGDPSIPHLFHALLTAELADNAGWDLLVQLADEAGDHDAKRAFKHRLRDEEEHLAFIREAIEAFTAQDVLGVVAPLPASP